MDRKKVIYDIERCIHPVGDSCRDCSKFLGAGNLKCMVNLMADALELLKEQEQEAEWIYGGEDETGVDGWYCSACDFFEPWFYDFDNDIDFISHYEHCPKCGRRMISYTGKQKRQRGKNEHE